MNQFILARKDAKRIIDTSSKSIFLLVDYSLGFVRVLCFFLPCCHPFLCVCVGGGQSPPEFGYLQENGNLRGKYPNPCTGSA